MDLICSDSMGDVCDTDDDNDGVLDIYDNCQYIANINQIDNDKYLTILFLFIVAATQ